MVRTYTPSMAVQTHRLAVYVADHQSTLDAAVALTGNAELIAQWALFKSALAAIDSFYNLLRPTQLDSPSA